MKKSILKFCFLFGATAAFSQAGHIMQGAGAFNMSMGGAATGNALDISGALQWNPASISAFDDKILKFDIGLFFSAPELTATADAGILWPANAFGPGSPESPAVKGTTVDDRGVSPLPALAMVWGSADSKHTFGASAIGISGFGVTFPEETNLPFLDPVTPNPNWDPTNSTIVNFPQSMGGFGRIESDYMLLQVGFTWAYELTDKLSIGIEPTYNYSALELMPNPTANPTLSGYPSTNSASATGFGGQVGVYFDTGNGFSAGASYKSAIGFSEFKFKNSYLDDTNGTSKFQMDFPAIISVGVGYSTEKIDIAVDYRNVNYEDTEGFEKTGWSPTNSVIGFGWQNITIVSAGIQYKGIDKFPLRAGYTYSTNPITKDVAFFNTPATAIIKNAFQFGITIEANDRLSLDLAYHHGTSSGATSGPFLNPLAVTPDNKLGSVDGTKVSYEMTTDLIMIGFNFKLSEGGE